MLRERGLLEKEEPYENTVGYSERANVPIEPRLSEQWFLKYPNIDDALALLRDGHVTSFIPRTGRRSTSTGSATFRIGASRGRCGGGIAFRFGWYSRRGRTREAASPLPGRFPRRSWTQDPDTLDTWFSSWLWAYETMRTDDGTRAKFYPTSALVTGPDIIFLWVARMLIAGLHFQPNGAKADKPATLEANLAFKDVYFTGLIRDKQGRKFSKSLGNSPEPLDLIAKYGADGLRFGLIRIAPQGADIRYDEKQIEEGRNFCNKLWNICRFRTMHGAIDPQADPSKHARSIFADELLRLLHDTTEAETAAIEAFNFSEAAMKLYAFVWDDFASRFVEAAKLDFTQPDSPTHAGTLATFDYVSAASCACSIPSLRS